MKSLFLLSILTHLHFNQPLSDLAMLKQRWKVVKVTKVMEGNLSGSITGTFDFTELKEQALTEEKEYWIEKKGDQLFIRTHNHPSMYFEVLSLSIDSLTLGTHWIHKDTDILVMTWECIPVKE